MGRFLVLAIYFGTNVYVDGVKRLALVEMMGPSNACLRSSLPYHNYVGMRARWIQTMWTQVTTLHIRAIYLSKTCLLVRTWKLALPATIIWLVECYNNMVGWRCWSVWLTKILSDHSKTPRYFLIILNDNSIMMLICNIHNFFNYFNAWFQHIWRGEWPSHISSLMLSNLRGEFSIHFI